MEQCIGQLDTGAARKQYRDGNFPRADMCKDVNMRYRWDLFWAANTSYPNTIRLILDAGYKDAHIDTALRQIVPNVKED
jgi:hypothetical protein